MQSILTTIQVLMMCGTLLVVALFALLSAPQCKLRAFLLPIVAWCFAIFCGLYAISPIDCLPEAFFGPFGFVDDLGAVVAGIMAARTAMTASKEAVAKE